MEAAECPNADCRAPNADCRVPNVECRVPSAERRVPNAESRVPNAECIMLKDNVYEFLSTQKVFFEYKTRPLMAWVRYL